MAPVWRSPSLYSVRVYLRGGQPPAREGLENGPPPARQKGLFNKKWHLFRDYYVHFRLGRGHSPVIPEQAALLPPADEAPRPAECVYEVMPKLSSEVIPEHMALLPLENEAPRTAECKCVVMHILGV